MTEEEKKEYISNIKYFWNEKGDIERFVNYSMEKLEEADPVIANAYKQYLLAEKTLNKLLGWSYE